MENTNFTFAGLRNQHFACSAMRKEFPSFRKKRQQLLVEWVTKNDQMPSKVFRTESEFFKATMTPEWFDWFTTTFNTLREWGVTTKGILTEEEKQQMAPPQD